MVLLISYDLNRGERPASYEAVRTMIEQHSISWAKPLYSQWFVETNESPDAWDARMRTVTDPDDRWFICEVTRNRQGWLSRKVWDWLNARS
jgi:hypothetical protein